MLNQGKKEQREKFAEVRTILNKIAPAVIVPEGMPRPPLAIGAHRDLIKAADGILPKNTVRQFLKVWCSRGKYLLAIAAGGYRYNIDGTGATPITMEDVEYARARLKNRRRYALHHLVTGRQKPLIFPVHNKAA